MGIYLKGGNALPDTSAVNATRNETLGAARQAAQAWGYWCWYTHWGENGGKPPRIASGGQDRRYRSPPQWHPAEPRLPEADENLGLAVQRAFIRLPTIYRGCLKAEFCLKPWIIPFSDHDLETVLARKARVSIGAYRVTVDRSLLALAHVMQRHGLWHT